MTESPKGDITSHFTLHLDRLTIMMCSLIDFTGHQSDNDVLCNS
jgi:hypothetical protein